MGLEKEEELRDLVNKILLPPAVTFLFLLFLFGTFIPARVVKFEKALGSGDEFFHCTAVHVGIGISSTRNRCVNFGVVEDGFNAFSCDDIFAVPLLNDLATVLCPGIDETAEGFDEALASSGLAAAILAGSFFITVLAVCVLNGYCCARFQRFTTGILFFINLGQLTATIGTLVFVGKALTSVRQTPWYELSIEMADIPGFSSEIGGIAPEGMYVICGGFNACFIIFMILLCFQALFILVLNFKLIGTRC